MGINEIRQRARDATIRYVARHGEVRATIMTTALAVAGSVAVLATADIFREITPFGYFLAALAPALVAPVIAYFAFSGFSYVVRLRAELEQQVAQRLKAEARLREMADTDELTGVMNRRSFIKRGVQELARASRHGAQVSLIMLDLDHFKAVNDTHGHAAGDWALVELVRLCRQELRAEDLLARLGGEEFAILMPQTRLAGARSVADRLRLCLNSEPMEYEEARFSLTVSAGVAELAAGEALEVLMARADAALYEAKRSGRNQVRAAV